MSRPYDFIPFLECKSYKEQNKTYSGKINLSIRTITPLHISTEQYFVGAYRKFIRTGDKVIIPGTTLKGAVKSIAEMVSYSCYFTPKYEKNLRLSVNKYHSPFERCIICSIFGTSGYRSKVRVSDFKMEKGNMDILSMPRLFRPKIDDFYKDEDGNIIGHKIYYHGVEDILGKGNMKTECVLKDAVFNGDIIYKDLDEEELSLLAFSLGITGDIQHKIGYGKPAYYGSVEVSSNMNDIINLGKNYKENKDKKIKENIDRLIKILSYSYVKRDKYE